MIQIRSSVFETNSSSMHSLVIRSKELMKELSEDTKKKTSFAEAREQLRFNVIKEDGKVVKLDFKEHGVTDWYFGRSPFRILSTFYEKLAYAYASFSYDKKGYRKEIEAILHDLFPDLKKIIYPQFVGTDEGLLSSWMDQYNFTIKDFLFNNQYIVICDGDEYCIFSDIMRANLFDDELATCSLRAELDDEVE